MGLLVTAICYHHESGYPVSCDCSAAIQRAQSKFPKESLAIARPNAGCSKGKPPQVAFLEARRGAHPVLCALQFELNSPEAVLYLRLGYFASQVIQMLVLYICTVKVCLLSPQGRN